MAAASRPRRDRPRVVGSRNATGRPRKIAGQSPSSGEPPETQMSETEALDTEPPETEPPETQPPETQPPETETAETQPPETETAETEALETETGAEGAGVSTGSTDETDPATGARAGRGRRMRVALAATVVLLLGVGAGEVWYLTRDDTPVPSESRPVVVGDATRGEAVESAARSTEEILSTRYQDYDDEVDEATAKMTATFAKEYQQTADGIRARFIAQQTKLQVQAVGQGVVRASPEQAQVLLFLNQYVEKVVDGQSKTDYAQYRALVTVVHTDHGWLVSDIATK